MLYIWTDCVIISLTLFTCPKDTRTEYGKLELFTYAMSRSLIGIKKPSYNVMRPQSYSCLTVITDAWKKWKNVLCWSSGVAKKVILCNQRCWWRCWAQTSPCEVEGGRMRIYNDLPEGSPIYERLGRFNHHGGNHEESPLPRLKEQSNELHREPRRRGHSRYWSHLIRRSVSYATTPVVIFASISTL